MLLRQNFLFYKSWFWVGAVAGTVVIASCRGTEAALPPGPPPSGMVLISGNDNQPSFYMDATEVTVARFGEFVAATGYVTEAEDFGWSGVFSKDSLAWLPVDGAFWRRPRGVTLAPASPQEPATQLSLRDVKAYLKWAEKELPTEAEWVFAASQSGQYREYPWGEEMLPGGEYLGNWWQGYFPLEDQVLDEFPGVAPVKSFPPAANGLYDISGNVWEWTDSVDPVSRQSIIKGGSFLCSTSYCTGFNLQQKQFTPADSGLNHLGFRGIVRVDE